MIVYIGRFQPLHNGHLNQIKYGLTLDERMLIIVGIKTDMRSVNNPFYFLEIENMIVNSLTPEEIQRVTITTQKDIPNNNKLWQYEICQTVHGQPHLPINLTAGISLLGNRDDSSTDYLNWFPLWSVHYHYNKTNFHATDVRNVLFGDISQDGSTGDYIIPNWNKLSSMVPEGTIDTLRKFVYDKYSQQEYVKLIEMYQLQRKLQNEN